MGKGKQQWLGLLYATFKCVSGLSDQPLRYWMQIPKVQYHSRLNGSMFQSEKPPNFIFIDNRILSLHVFKFFHSSRLIRWIQQNKIYKKFRDLSRNRTQINCLAVRRLSHYTRMFSVLLSGCNWMLFMHGWFCPIRLIHLIGWKSLHFENNRLFCSLYLRFFVWTQREWVALKK